MPNIRIAVKSALSSSATHQPLLANLEKDENFTTSCIQYCIDNWNLDVPSETEITDEFVLLSDSKPLNHEDIDEIQDGWVLKLAYTTKTLVKKILDGLKTHGNSGSETLIEKLIANDNDFREALIDENEGVSIIMDRLGYDLDTHEDAAMINILLEALCLLISQISVSDKVLLEIEERQDLISKVIEGMHIQNWDCPSKNWNDSRMKQALIFLTVIQKSENCCQLVRKSVDVRRLIEGLILNREVQRQVRINALALFNEIVLNEAAENRGFLIAIMEKSQMAKSLAEEFYVKDGFEPLVRKQLYYVQCWSLRKYQQLKYELVKNEDGNALNMIRELRIIAFNHDKQGVLGGKASVKNQRHQNANEFKNLGFVSHRNPAQDFQKPPGMLGLKLMYKFAEEKKDVFNKLVMESTYRGDGCPYALSSIGLVKILCDVFNVDKDPKLQLDKIPVYKFILTDPDNFFQEAFNATIEHLFLTWREMRASNTFANDLEKVMDVTKDQILMALSKEPTSMDKFTEDLPRFGKIADSWRDRNMQKSKEDCGAIRALREALKDDIIGLIIEQRLNFVCKGTFFIKPPQSRRTTYTYMKLSQNKKTICYGDFAAKIQIPEMEDLTGKILISDIRDFGAGTAGREKRATMIGDKTMTIMSADNTQLDVIAEKDDAFHCWSDAINYLLGREGKKSQKFNDDLDLLLGHEVRLRLLDLEDVKLPDEAPPIPPLPTLPVPSGIF